VLRDRGSITPLIIGYAAIAIALVMIGVDVSKVFLAERALSSAADTAALAAAQGVDVASVYDGPGVRCGRALPLDPRHAQALAADSVAAEAADLRHAVVTLTGPRTTLQGGTVGVALSAQVALPFGRVVGWLDPALPDGRIPIHESAFARSPVAGGAC
jgi:hypothetical protein